MGNVKYTSPRINRILKIQNHNGNKIQLSTDFQCIVSLLSVHKVVQAHFNVKLCVFIQFYFSFRIFPTLKLPSRSINYLSIGYMNQLVPEFMLLRFQFVADNFSTQTTEWLRAVKVCLCRVPCQFIASVRNIFNQIK